ncbi:hypothetical protein ACS0TY_030480 [Phlomoides rotata]
MDGFGNVGGWKADNGLKAGFQQELEKGMRKILTGTDISATPHINSKIHVWKKEYGLLTDLLSKSGIGWNSLIYTLDINDEAVWDAQRRVDPGVKTMRAKSWPYYESWVDIFGKDRATGEHVVDPIDIVNEMMNNTVEQEGETGERCDVFTTKNHGVDENTFVAQPSQSGFKTSAKGKKCKIMDQSMSAFVETIGEYMKGSDETFITIAQRMGSEYDAKVAQTTLNDVMKLIPGLSMRGKLKVSDELVL